MEWYKLMGAFLVVLSGGLWGGYLNRAASLTLRQTEAWIRLLRYVKLRIDCFSQPAPEILARVDETLLRECGFLGEARPSRFSELLSLCEVKDGQTLTVLREFAEAFGKGYREEQIRECDYYIGLLESEREALASLLTGRKKLNTVLSLSGALALVIFFL